MRHYLFEILTVTFSTPDTNKETYNVFGMLLSGCQIRRDISESYSDSEVIKKVIISLQDKVILIFTSTGHPKYLFRKRIHNC